MSNYKTVFFYLGILQIILGIFMLIPVIVQFLYNEIDSSFFGASIVTIIFGTLFFLSNLDHDKKLNLQQAFLLTALSWLSIAIFGSLPFVFSTVEFSFTNAFFESMSGITTTGSTIISNLERYTKRNFIMESNSSVVRGNRYNCNGYNTNANNECWWNAIIQNFK